MHKIDELLTDKYNAITHTDADGIASAVIAKEIKLIKNIDYADEFGDFNNHNLMLDMNPNREGFYGFIIDHHPVSIYSDKHIMGTEPTTVMMYYIAKKSKRKFTDWKVVIGAVGDGQPETVPSEVWVNHPELFSIVGRYYDQYGKVSIKGYPLFYYLSSRINSACRVGKPEIAFNILYKANTPFDIIHNEQLKEYKQLVDKEVDIQTKNALIEEYSKFIIVYISSKYNITGLVASKISSNTYKTIIVANTITGKVSMRGILTEYLVNHFKREGIKAGGHLGFAGASFTDLNSFRSFLRSIVSSF